VKATFFVTNLMTEIYKDLIPALHAHGHEIGLHGLYHEYLSTRDQAGQRTFVEQMQAGFGGVPVRGVNFIGRMNEDTLSCLPKCGIRYFVQDLIHDYIPFRFLTFPTRVTLMAAGEGKISRVPISVETYGRPWRLVKGMLDSALQEAKREGTNHVSILMHPFRDGSRRHIGSLEKMLKYLSGRRMRGISLKDWALDPVRGGFLTPASERKNIRPDLSIFPSRPRTVRDLAYGPLGGWRLLLAYSVGQRSVF